MYIYCTSTESEQWTTTPNICPSCKANIGQVGTDAWYDHIVSSVLTALVKK